MRNAHTYYVHVFTITISMFNESLLGFSISIYSKKIKIKTEYTNHYESMN